VTVSIEGNQIEGNQIVGNQLRHSVDVVIVTHRSASVILECLDSIASESAGSLSSIVVVESSGASTAERGAAAETRANIAAWNQVPGRKIGATFVDLAMNVGFGSAMNRGIALGSAAFVAVLNPDVVVHEGCLEALVATLEICPSLAACGPTVLNLDGTVYPSGRTFPDFLAAVGHGSIGLFFPKNRWTRRYIGNPETPDWISGTAMLMRRADFEIVGGFDERYFMYVEDVDLCWRWNRTGKSVSVVREATLTHVIGASSSLIPLKMIVAHHRSLFRFVSQKGSSTPRVLLPVVALGLVARSVVLCGVRWRQKRPPAAYHEGRVLVKTPESV
jgi:N-acetylglucosaminyl-diphospho-decaprenol L-rhamnosyltransferase